jgi:hypothetical protein
MNKIIIETNFNKQFSNGENISMFMMNVKCLIHFVNDSTCKDKWASILGYFKKINS